MLTLGWRNAIHDSVRRTLLLGLAGLLVSAAGEEKLAWDFSVPAIEGGDLDFSAFKGRVLLVVNTASMCGYTSQYTGLQKLHTTRAGQGLAVIGVPSRDFRQEYADDAAVKYFCETNFGVTFPLTTVSHVKGPSAIPFYAWARAQAGWEPSWNFNKLLIGRDGRLKATFGAGDDPLGQKVQTAIAAELAAR